MTENDGTMGHLYRVTITVPVYVPIQWDNPDDVEEFITDTLDREVGVAYEIDAYSTK